ncbi:hypothetical protein ASG43_17430 [Aureimonas sp. Leaf454]|nr:hypothetical protein ASG43_17430 [Aureimonas sp. Leaf454]
MRIVRDGLWGATGEKPCVRTLVERTGIPRATVYGLLDSKNRFETQKHRARINMEASRYLKLPWGETGEELRQDLITVLQADFPFYDTARLEARRALIERRLHDARTAWTSHVLDETALRSTRVLYGLMAIGLETEVATNAVIQKVFLETTAPLNRLRAPNLSPIFAAVGDLLAESNLPALYGTDVSHAKYVGARWLRIRFWGNRIALTLSQTEIAGWEDLMQEACHGGYVDACNWAADLTAGVDLTPLQNAWVATMVAGRWSDSVVQAARLFEAFPQYLHSQTAGMRPQVEDKDQWPGLAAIVAFPENAALATTRDWLNNINQRRDHGHLAETLRDLAAALPEMTARLRANPGISYLSLRNTIGAQS